MRMSNIISIVCLSLLVSVTLAVKGVDTQFNVTVAQMKCIKENIEIEDGKEKVKQYFITLRAWNGNRTLMPNIHENLKNAQDGGVNAS